jgi:multisubunit Na+/H+ antiporter MnhB subunit
MAVRALCVGLAVVLVLLAAFGVGDGDPDLALTGLAAFFGSFFPWPGDGWPAARR